MRVLHVTPSIATAYGGPTQSLRGYLTACRSAGIEAHVVAPRAPGSDSDAVGEIIGEKALHEFITFGRGAAVFSLGLVYWLTRNVSRYQVLHVHGLLNPISSLAARLGVGAGVPTIVRPTGTLSRYTATYRRAALKAAYFRVLERPTLQRVAAVHFTSEQEQREAAWHGMVVTDAGCVIPPPYAGIVGSPRTHPGPGDVALFMGRFHPVKNLEALLVAWDDVARDSPEARLVLAGSGDSAHERALRSRAHALSAAESVSFVGFVDGREKERLLAKAALLVLPSYHENLGIAALEAIAHGVPVVVTHTVHLSSFVATHGLGVVCDHDAGSLAKAISTVLADTELRDRCGTQGPELVRRHFSVEATGARLRQLYESVIRSRGITPTRPE